MQLDINPLFEKAFAFTTQTNKSIFLTGKAGTGKTTLLKHIKQNCTKQMAVVAPTGVAAINAGGVTIHSFFQLPFGPFTPSSANELLGKLKYTSQRRNIMRQLELLIVDEISMVRADVLDAIDTILKSVRRTPHLPFGGVQLLFIGDMFQLPPVVKDEEWQILQDYYLSPFFFDSKVLQHERPIYIELEKIYRQNNQAFIDILNKVRNNALDNDSLEILNKLYQPDFAYGNTDGYITLCTHNYLADEINKTKLEELKTPAFTFKAETDGSFLPSAFPAEENLTLKKGAQVMFIKNDPEKNYFNGKIGVITQLSNNEIKVQCKGDYEEITVAKNVWRNVSYNLNKENKTIEEEELGTFTQYPLRLAWAITIHKSQGLTFDKAIIDAGKAFSAGQVYVALSRCTSLEGIVLKSKISTSTIMNNNEVLMFSNSKPSEQELNNSFSSEKNKYIQFVLTSIFDLSLLKKDIVDLKTNFLSFPKHFSSEMQNWASEIEKEIIKLNDVSQKFKSQINLLCSNTNDAENDVQLQERLNKAASYFIPELNSLIQKYKTNTVSTESKEAANAVSELLNETYISLLTTQHLMACCQNNFNLQSFVKQKLSLKLPSTYFKVYGSNTSSNNQGIPHPELYSKLAALRDEIVETENKPIYLVANRNTLLEICEFLPLDNKSLTQISGFGETKVKQYGSAFLKIIKEYVSENDLEGNINSKIKVKPKKEKKESVSKIKKPDTKEASFILFKSGKSIDEIAQLRSMVKSTINAHLNHYLKLGEIDIDKLVSKEKQQIVLDLKTEKDFVASSSYIKSKVGDKLDWDEIRFVLTSMGLFKAEI